MFELIGSLTSHDFFTLMICRTNSSNKWSAHVTEDDCTVPQECDECQHKAKTKRGLVRHKRLAHGTSTVVKAESAATVFQCEACPKKFSKKATLASHTQFVHLGLKPHQCPQCDKVFAKKYLLDDHLSTHSGVKLLQCDMCTFQCNR